MRRQPERAATALDQEAAGVTSQVNSLTTAIAQLNLQIQSTSPNGDAGTLEDQRQQDLSQLSQLIGINQVTTENNGSVDHHHLGAVAGFGRHELSADHRPVNGVTHFFVGSNDVTRQLTRGAGNWVAI